MSRAWSLSFALYPLVAAVVLKSSLAFSKFRIGRRIASTSLEADAWHDVTDLISTAIAFTATILILVSSYQIRGSRPG